MIITQSPAWRTLLILMFTSLLVACGGSSSSGSKNSLSPPVAAVASADTKLGVRDNIVIRFDKPMDPSTLELKGLLVNIAANPSWNDDKTQLTLRPIEGAWESGRQRITGMVRSKEGAVTTLDFNLQIRLVFDTFQSASIVIGQVDFESAQSNQGGSPAGNTLDSPYGMPSFADGRLWIPDYGNDRILGFDGIPTANNASAAWVAGQADFHATVGGTSNSEFDGPQMGVEHDGYFYMLEYGNDRISIFDHIPPVQATNVIGQPNLNTNSYACTATGLSTPEAMQIVDNKLLVADKDNNRVLIWNSVPRDTNAEPADLVLGQASMTTCQENDDDQDGSADSSASARTLYGPTGVWSDGRRVVIADSENNRVLIWNSFPSENFQPADVVLGQPTFYDNDHNNSGELSAKTLGDPYYGVWSNGLQLIVADSYNNRILLWDNFPTENFQAADVVLGQSDFIHNSYNDDDQDGIADPTPSARVFEYPSGLGVYRDKLVVIDLDNNRALVFESH